MKRLIAKEQHNAIPNGILCLKGGDLTQEVRPFRHEVLIDELKNYFDEPYFKTKKVVYLPL